MNPCVNYLSMIRKEPLVVGDDTVVASKRDLVDAPQRIESKDKTCINYLSMIKKEQATVGDDNVASKKDLIDTPQRIDLPKSQGRDDDDDCINTFKDSAPSSAQHQVPDVKKKNWSSTYLTAIQKTHSKAGPTVPKESVPATSLQGIVRAKIQDHGKSASSNSNPTGRHSTTDKGDADVERPP